MHCEPFAEQRAQIGCSLLHLTLEAAQASHEARSFGFLSGVEGLEDPEGTEVGESIGGEGEGPRGKACCHSGLGGVKDIVMWLC